jgi:tRNA 2-selenouridine synthase
MGVTINDVSVELTVIDNATFKPDAMDSKPSLHRHRFPMLCELDDVLAGVDKFDTIIDVRSPSEFALDHIPGAINCPVLDDQQRCQVGTLYKQVNAFEAKKIGAALVSQNIGIQIQQHFIDKPRAWRPLVYCWRGGNRSGAMAHVLARIGWPALQLNGGYKVFRRHVNDILSSQVKELRLRVICGTTGSGKSRLLQTLKQSGAQVLDLEQLAAHRGSVLGHLPQEAQPSQKLFETRIWDDLSRFDLTKDVFIESESKKVGDVRIPDALMERMRSAPCVAVNMPEEARVALLMNDYAHFVGDPAALNRQLACLTALYGTEKINQWQSMVTRGDFHPLVTALLKDHYDPAYRRSIQRNFSQYENAITLDLAAFTESAFTTAAHFLHPQEH